MANLVETTNDWPEGVYQLETNDPVVGGIPNPSTGAGMSNIPHLQLAQRTNWLKASVDSLLGAVASFVPMARLINTSGLATGGGDLTANRTITVPKATTAEAVAGTDDTKALTPLSGKALLGSATPTSRQINTSGLATGGGDLTADRTITVPKATTAEAVAGTDDTKALTPLSGKALVDAQALGAGQSWVNVEGSRVFGTAYQNTTSKVMLVSVVISQGSGPSWVFEISDDGVSWTEFVSSGITGAVQVFALIEAGGYYRARVIGGSPNIINFLEFR